MKSLLPVLLFLLGACSSDTDAAEADVARMREAIAELMARPEHDAETVEIQHCLIGVAGHPALTHVIRDAEEAERLTAVVWTEALDGADFDDLVREHTDDAHPGIYELTAAEQAPEGAEDQIFPRRLMARAFGDVAWRLEVGEIGVAAYDREEGSSPYGWHIVKRLR